MSSFSQSSPPVCYLLPVLPFVLTSCSGISLKYLSVHDPPAADDEYAHDTDLTFQDKKNIRDKSIFATPYSCSFSIPSLDFVSPFLDVFFRLSWLWLRQRGRAKQMVIG